MSADKDRGIRRQKQKRAKDSKAQEKQQPRTGAAASSLDDTKRYPPYETVPNKTRANSCFFMMRFPSRQAS